MIDGIAAVLLTLFFIGWGLANAGIAGSTPSSRVESTRAEQCVDAPHRHLELTSAGEIDSALRRMLPPG